ncbi:MAG: protein BatD [Bacteroidetes bacterium]|nr:protein BatD [Bacteroidota bacterium]
MKFSIAILFLLLTPVLWSQAPAIEVSVSKTTVEEGEIFTYQIIANQDCPVTAPDFGELEVVGGPEKGYSSSSYTVNNVTTKQNQYSLTFYLRAPKKGTYSIPPASMKCKLKKVNSGDAVTIKVVAGGNPGNNSSQQNTSNGNYYLKITTDKNSVYVGEPFLLTLKFYSVKKPTQIESIEDGNASGIWRKDLNPNRLNYTMTQETIRGLKYYVLELKQELCIAERAGKIIIDPYYASLIHSQDIFTSVREDGTSNSLTIDVKKLPVETPSDFNGLIGRFDLVHEIDKTSLTQGQSFELNIRITGTGNFNAFDEPKLSMPAGFTLVDPEVTDETEVTTSGLRGSINYKFIVTANEPGDFEVQPFGFSYFDLSSKSMKQLSTEKFTVHVEKGDENHGAVYKGQKVIDIENTDIHFIHDKPNADVNLNDFVFGSLPYLTLVTVPPVLVFLVMLLRRKKQNISPEDKAESTKKGARKTAQKSLSQALQLLKSGDDKGALKLLQNTLITYLMAKLNLSLSNLSLKSITTELEHKKAPTQVMLELSHVWKKIEMAQYAPITSQNLGDTIRETQKLVDQLDENI